MKDNDYNVPCLFHNSRKIKLSQNMIIFATKERIKAMKDNYHNVSRKIYNNIYEWRVLTRAKNCISPVVIPLENSVERKKQKQMAVTV